MKWQCPHNEGVECTKKQCDRCGWNPEVTEQRRKEAAIAAGVCPYISAVLCSDMKCDDYGWNPEVAAKRERKVRYGLSDNHE